MKRKEHGGALASENRRQRGNGRPFARGNSAGRPFASGESGNPGGRPKDAPGFRERCREMAAKLLEALGERIDGGELTTDEILRALEIIADRGGYLSADKLASAEGARWRWGLALLGFAALTDEQRRQAFDEMAKREREVLGEPPPPPAVAGPSESNKAEGGS